MARSEPSAIRSTVNATSPYLVQRRGGAPMTTTRFTPVIAKSAARLPIFSPDDQNIERKKPNAMR